MQELQADGLLHLSVLEHNSGVALIAVGMVFSEHLERLIIPVLGQQPTWGPASQSQRMARDISQYEDLLRNPPDEGELDDGKDTLDEGGDSPGPRVTDVLCAKCQPATDESTEIPQAVVDGGDPGTMLRMRDLGDEHRAGELSHGVAETHEEARALVLWATHSGGLNGSGDDHDNATNGDGVLATKLVAEPRHDGERNDATDRVHGAETTQGVFRGVTHCVLPGVKDLRSVHERPSHS